MLKLMGSDQSWRQEAACDGYDPDLFFPEAEPYGNDRYEADIKKAKKVCLTCSVVKPCLALGVEDANIRFGIYGGLTSEERIKLSGKKVYRMNGTRGNY